MLAVAESISARSLESDGAAHELAQHAQIERLGDEIEGAQLERAHGGFNIAVRRDDGDRQVGAVLLDPGDEIEAVAVGKAHVGETQIELLVLQQAARGGDIGRGARVEIHAAQREADELEQVGLVIDDQHDGPYARNLRARSCHCHHESGLPPPWVREHQTENTPASVPWLVQQSSAIGLRELPREEQPEAGAACRR